MNTNATTIRRRIAAGVVTAIAFSTFAGCGTEVSPPSQDIGKVGDKQSAPPQPSQTSVRRMDFGDEYGKARAPKHDNRPAGSGTRNRMDFRDKGW